ncbi:hypothetical protein [Streptomyces boncukensis]|uniref:Transmembrane protein n=1 Tax=Streptomyces boncukensis TaxID=2711219 RepID=A0A6G4WWD1_9ACTN|nr:hypothetical protein [Streptomyces boncukensis]NGO69535.1 hypothetical protein [Streptomyces boncukensis]
MEASPRDGDGTDETVAGAAAGGDRPLPDPRDALAEALDGPDGPEPQDEAEPEADGPADGPSDGPDAAEEAVDAAVEPQELRPQRKLRLWQLAPIVALGALGSLMFAFPLAFEPGGSSGAVVSMLGLLICGCAAGWGVMAARRVGHTWPGLPARGSDRRPDWRVVAVYAVVVCTVVVLAVLRVARLR